MDSSFMEHIENSSLKLLVEKILKLFSELLQKDSALAILLVQYLVKHPGNKSEKCDSFTIPAARDSTISCKYTQTEFNELQNGWDMKDITNEVKQVAEQCMNQTGLNYDGSSGTYYNKEEGYYYLPDYRLYYYPQLGAYYYYDEATDSLKFHSAVNNGEVSAMDTDQSGCSETAVTSHRSFEGAFKNKESNKSSKSLTRRKMFDEKEEGELSSSDNEDNPEELNTQVIFESGPKAFEPDHSKHNAPYMRMVIVKSDLENYPSGTLFIITRDGGTLGREGVHHEILIPDSNVSKDHLKFQYVYKGDKEQRYAYEIIDLGSRNGTRVNGKRLSKPNEQSKPEEITHGTVLTVGSTTLLCHIHQGLDCCSECQTAKASSKEENHTGIHLSSKQHYRMQMMQMKQKYQLDVLTENDILPKGYMDRAKVRRETIGSSHDSEKTEVASIHSPMSKNNKGYSLLSKMGWKEGNALGKNALPSTQEPLYVEPKVGKTGFGA